MSYHHSSNLKSFTVKKSAGNIESTRVFQYDIEIHSHDLYNRAITVPDFVLTQRMREFQDKLEEKLTETLQTLVDAKIDELRHTRGLVDKDELFGDIIDELQTYLESDVIIQKIDSMLQKIIKQL